MVFASFIFLCWFLPVFLAGYYCLPLRAKNVWLTFASYAFYMWHKPQYALLMLTITVIDYCVGLGMGSVLDKPQRRRALYTAIGLVAALAFGLWAHLQLGRDPKFPGTTFQVPVTWLVADRDGMRPIALGIGVVGVLLLLASGISGEESRGRRKLWLLVSIVTNLALLGWFKYANLLVDTWNTIQQVRGAQSVPWEKVFLPVGISFFTFQSMSYTIDVYRKEVKPTFSLLDFACFVSMFPQLVAGPIVRYRDVMEELVARKHSYMLFSTGAVMFMIGFAKKVLLADNCALIADPVFAAAAPGCVAAWTGVVAYAMQIYFDFSGYSDMAIGLGWMLGFQFPTNFDSPYKSLSITEFWRRWHMSLSTWLRDYLYVSLGGNRHGEGRTYFNLMATMLLGGLWHGPSWTFLLWGGYQGVFLVIERLCGRQPFYARAPRLLAQLLTFVIVLGGWAIFRANTMAGLGSIYGGMFGLHGWGSVPWPELHGKVAYLTLGFASGIAFFLPNSIAILKRFDPLVILGVIFGFAIALGQFFTRDYSPFIYFQF